MPPNADRASASRARIGVGRIGAGGDAARVGVLHDHGGGLGELEHDARRRVEIQQVQHGSLPCSTVAAPNPVRCAGAYQAPGW